MNSKEKALRQIRQMQAEHFQSLKLDTQSRAQTIVDQREKEPDGWIYQEEYELARLQLTREIIGRVEPGPHENPLILEKMARHAASIEMYLEKANLSSEYRRFGELSKCVLVASTMEPHSNAYATPLLSTNMNWFRGGLNRLGNLFTNSKSFCSNYTLVTLSAGIIEFLDLTARAVVASWQPGPEHENWVSTQTDPRALANYLQNNDLPAELLFGALRSYFFRGWPEYQRGKDIGSQYDKPHSVLITMSERWLIAHEYSHALLHQLSSDSASGRLSTKEMEYEADRMALEITIGSAYQFDLLPPNLAFSGAEFVLNCLDVLLRRAIGVMQNGEAGKDIEGVQGYPSFGSRSKVLVQHYRQLQDSSIAYEGHSIPRYQFEHGELIDIWDIGGAKIGKNTLDLIWSHVQPKLLSIRNDEPLHSIWVRP